VWAISESYYVFNYRSRFKKKSFPANAGKPFSFHQFLVGAVGIEFIKAQNLKELCGMCCSRKSFADALPR
jgi:hypothetical protein